MTKCVAVLLLLALALAVAGCELFPELMVFWDDGSSAKSFASELQDAKGERITTKEGSLDPAGAAKLGKRLLTDSSGDKEADAALDSAELVKRIAEADKLATEGWQKKDPALLGQAIELRPNDWSYRIDFAAMLMSSAKPPTETEVAAISEDLQKANDLVFRETEAVRLRYAHYGIQRLEAVRSQLLAIPEGGGRPRLYTGDGRLCSMLLSQLNHQYAVLGEITGSADDREMAAQYIEDRKNCAP